MDQTLVQEIFEAASNPCADYLDALTALVTIQALADEWLRQYGEALSGFGSDRRDVVLSQRFAGGA